MRRALLFFVLSGCAQGMRVRKFLATETLRMEVSPVGQLAEVGFADGYNGDQLVPFAPDVEIIDGREMLEPQVLTSRGRISILPKEPVNLEIWIRHRGVNRRDFFQLRTLSGGLERSLATEIRRLPTRVSEPGGLSMADVGNVYNDDSVEDGDLLMVGLSNEAGLEEHYLYQMRQLGFRGKGGAGVLVQLPLPGGDPAVTLSPVLALSFAVGYRFSTQSPTLRWAGDKLAIVGSIGIGSTAVETAEVDVQQLNSLLNAALVGGGIEVYNILSIQMFGNLSSAFRDAAEDRATLAVGFDAVQFGRVTRNAGARLFKKNKLDAAGGMW